MPPTVKVFYFHLRRVLIEMSKTAQSTKPMPVVFMFSPSQYRVIPNEDLSDWESLLLKRLGVRAELRSGSLPTVSFCGSGTAIEDACDCDTLAA